MRNSLFMGLALGLVVCMAGPGQAEPRFQGKPADHWLKLAEHADADQRRAAVFALGQIGPEKPDVSAALIGAVKDKEASVRLTAIAALGNMGPVDRTVQQTLRDLLQDKDPASRHTAVRALGQLATKNPAMVQVLVESLQDKNIRQAAAEALGNLGPKCGPAAAASALRLAVNDPDGHFRLTATEAAGKLISCVRTFDPRSVYLAALKDKDPEVRTRAIRLAFSDGAGSPEAWTVLAGLLADKNPGVRNQASLTLHNQGATGVPYLVKLLAHDDAQARQSAASLLGRFREQAKAAAPALTRALDDKDQSVRLQAAVALWHVGQKAEPVLPTLLEALKGKDANRRHDVFEVLEQLGAQAKPAIPVLVQTLIEQAVNGSRDDISWAIEDVLIDLGPDAVPSLIQALKHANPKVREQIAGLFGRMRKPPKEVAPALVEAMKGMSSFREVGNAFRVLGADGVPVLLRALSHEDPKVRKEVVVFLNRSLPRNQAAPAELLQAAKDNDVDVRRVAIHILCTFDPPERAAIPVLAEALKDEAIRNLAAALLGRFGPAAKEALPALQATSREAVRGRCPGESGFGYQLAATRAIFRIQQDAPAVLPVLWGLTSCPVPAVGQEAEAALVEIGPEAVPFLRSGLADPSAGNRARAARVLGRINPGNPAGVPDIAKALQDPDEEVRLAAVRALAGLGEKARDAAPQLGKALKDKSQPVRLAALEALDRMGAAAKDALPALVETLQEGNFAAIRIVGRFGPEAKAAVPTLRTLQDVKNLTLAVAAAEALWKIDGQAQEVVPTLCVILNHPPEQKQGEEPSLEVQLAAARVLAEIGPQAKSAIPFLVEGLQYERRMRRCKRTPDEHLRETVVAALVGHGAEAVPYLVDALGHDKPQVRTSVFEVLTKMGPMARAAVPALTEAIQDKEPSFRAAAAAAFKAIDPPAAAAAGVK